MNPLLVVAGIDGLIKLIEFFSKLRKNNAVTAAWTPEQRAAIDVKWKELKSMPHWQVDPE